MSDEDIRLEYRQAKDRKKQLQILADENLCSVGTIRRIVSGEDVPDLSGFVPIQDLMEKEAKTEETKMNERYPEPTAPTADPPWPPVIPAPPDAGKFQDEAELPGPGPSSLPDVQDLPAQDAGVLTGVLRPRTAAMRYFLTGRQFSELWFILGKLQGVLEAAAEAGKPGEVMKDAVDELESLVRSLDK